ncbi:acyltransferase [Lacunimicrobium album]
MSIGDNTLIGPNVLIYSQNHRFRGEGLISSQGYDRKPVSIGSNVWIAANVLIMPGVNIGDNAVIAAGSIVTKDVPGNHLLHGDRAKHLKDLMAPAPVLETSLATH